jgi:hypothetical protein
MCRNEDVGSIVRSSWRRNWVCGMGGSKLRGGSNCIPGRRFPAFRWDAMRGLMVAG